MNLRSTNIKNKSVAILNLTPLLQENGRVKKIVSFTLDYTLNSNTAGSAVNKSIASYTDRSVLAMVPGINLRSTQRDIFKIDKDLLQKIGINTAGLDPKNIRIYGNGGKMLSQLNSDFRYDDLQENAIFVEGEQDGVFDNDRLYPLLCPGTSSLGNQ